MHALTQTYICNMYLCWCADVCVAFDSVCLRAHDSVLVCIHKYMYVQKISTHADRGVYINNENEQ